MKRPWWTHQARTDNSRYQIAEFCRSFMGWETGKGITFLWYATGKVYKRWPWSTLRNSLSLISISSGPHYYRIAWIRCTVAENHFTTKGYPPVNSRIPHDVFINTEWTLNACKCYRMLIFPGKEQHHPALLQYEAADCISQYDLFWTWIRFWSVPHWRQLRYPQLSHPQFHRFCEIRQPYSRVSLRAPLHRRFLSVYQSDSP